MEDRNQDLASLARLTEVELADCGPENWPHLCRLKSTPEGLEKIKSHVLRLCESEGIPVGTALALLEQDFTHP